MLSSKLVSRMGAGGGVTSCSMAIVEKLACCRRKRLTPTSAEMLLPTPNNNNSNWKCCCSPSYCCCSCGLWLRGEEWRHLFTFGQQRSCYSLYNSVTAPAAVTCAICQLSRDYNLRAQWENPFVHNVKFNFFLYKLSGCFSSSFCAEKCKNIFF